MKKKSPKKSSKPTGYAKKTRQRLTLKVILTELIASLVALIAGAALIYDFSIRFFNDEPLFCYYRAYGCISEELFFGVALAIGGLIGLGHLYYAYQFSRRGH